MQTLEIVLVRHAESVPPGTPGWEDRDEERPLTEKGLRQAYELAFELEPYILTACYASPYPRALQTVTPTAQRRFLDVQLLADLRERLLVRDGTRDWHEDLAQSWTDADYAPPGGESGRAAQRRGVSVLDLLRTRHADGGRLLVGSHGNLIALILQALEPGVGAEFHMAMPMPAVYHLQHDGIGWRVMGGHGFAAVDRRN